MTLFYRGITVGVLCAVLLACSVPQLRPTPGAPTAALDADRLVVITVANPPAPGMRGAGSTWRGWDMGGSYQVASDAQGVVAELSAAYDMTAVDAWPIAVLGVHCVVFQLPVGEARDAQLKRLAADARVESAQSLQVFGTATRDTETPPRELQYSLQTMQIPQAHRWAQGRGVRVAIIDTGVDYRHPKLAGRVEEHLDLVGRDEPFEDDRHGTAVAGVIAAVDAGGGILGVAPQAHLIALKACWPLKAGAAEAACNTFTLARALAAAVELKADVVNLSLAGPPDPLLNRLVVTAIARGALVIGAMPDTGGDTFPSSVPGVIAVRSMSLRGSGVRRSVAAPGEDIISTAPNGAYALQSGSSLAAAHVSGVAALLREHRRTLSAAEFEQLLVESSGASGTGVVDAGSINACSAVTRSLGGGACPSGS